MRLRRQHRKHWMLWQNKFRRTKLICQGALKSKTIKYEISRQTEQFHWESIEIPSMTTGLLIQAGMQEKCRCMAFILVKDPDGIIRLQKLLGHGEQKLGIGLTTRETSIGGVPGEIQAGTWQIGVGIFTEYVAQILGEDIENLFLSITEVSKKKSG